jgi:hypothetical protein
MHRLLAAPLLLLALAACATPLERCIATANADARALEVELAERQLAVARGFRLETRLEPRFAMVLCPGASAATPGLCPEVVETPVTRRLPINPVIEGERIAALEAILARERARAAQSVATCRATIPA